ncbi:MAG: MFS transporter [Burkholderiaceae bacterium]|nr:MAG: MFS transporter [Burkholderiaceae bacterium]
MVSTPPLRAASAFLQTIVVLWFAGFAMRVTLLAIPPVLPQLQHALALTQTEVGVLSGLPTLLFAVVAIPGAALIAHFGVRATLLLGLLVTALAGAARALSPDSLALFAATLVMSAGIAIIQPAMPPLVRAWAPKRVNMATAVYSNGMLCSEAIAAALTIPLVLPLLDGSWRWALVFWSLPVIVAGALVAWHSRRHSADPVAAGTAAEQARHARWWPDWRDARMWKLGIVTGAGSAIFYTVNGFLPGYLTHTGQGDWLNAGLAALNLGQIPPTLALLFAGKQLGLKRSSYVVVGVIATLSLIGVVTTTGAWMIAWCALAGACCGFIITLGFALPALLAEPGDVHRLAGAMIAVAYFIATLAPVAGGISWDATQQPAMAFAPAIVAAIAISAVGALLPHAPRPATRTAPAEH